MLLQLEYNYYSIPTSLFFSPTKSRQPTPSPPPPPLLGPSCHSPASLCQAQHLIKQICTLFCKHKHFFRQHKHSTLTRVLTHIHTPTHYKHTLFVSYTLSPSHFQIHTQICTHIHTLNIYIYIYIYIWCELQGLRLTDHRRFDQ